MATADASPTRPDPRLDDPLYAWPSPQPNPLPPMMFLHGVRLPDSRLFKLRAWVNGHIATILLDSGASDMFIDTAFARQCGLTLSPSDRSIRLADGSTSKVAGQTTATCSLAASEGSTVPFEATFTATTLESYDIILGMTWLTHHDPVIGWRNRSITLRTPGRPHRTITPLECLNEEPTVARLAEITCKGLQKAFRRGQVEELFLIRINSTTHKPEPVGSNDPDIKVLLGRYKDVWPEELPHASVFPDRGYEHRIDLKPGAVPPPVRPLRHQSAKDSAVMDEYCKAGIASGQLLTSQSPYGAMALVVRKKDGTNRVVVDYRALNDITIKNKYPLPLMDELFDRVYGANFFTKLDLRSGFHQIRIHPDDREKTAFRTRFGSFEYTVLPMGLCNAPGTFMQLMNETFRDMLDRCVLVFLDDILIFSRTKEEHLQHLEQVFERLRKQKLFIKLSKCEFLQEQVEFLGHRIGKNGLAVSPDKVKDVREWRTPKDVSDVRSFLGLANFYRRFVKDYSLIALPMSELTKNDVKFVWGDEQQKAFDTLKDKITTAPVLIIPDPKLPYVLNCDACAYAVGATLQQDQGNGLQPVAFRSRKLTPAERNYDVREREFLALVDACSHWRPYLHGVQPFRLLSDHDSLKYHRTMPNLTGRLARWVEKMAEFDYTFEYIPGVKNVVADALSRRSDLKPGGSEEALNAARVRPPPPDPADEEEQRRKNRAAAEESHPPAPDRPQPNSKGAIVMPAQRCTARTKKGEHCRQRTAKGQFCWCHLASERGLRIKASTIPNAGLGLFAARPLPKGHFVDYTGDRVPLDSDSDGGVYFLEVKRGEAIDAARTNAGEGRWVNDPRGTDRDANAKFKPVTVNGVRIAGVETTRPVAKGEEILVKYGAGYWRFHRKKSKRIHPPAARKTAARGVKQAVLNTVTEAIVSSSLTEAILRAAKADEDYRRRTTVETLPVGQSVTRAHNGDLLFEGQRLVVPNDAELRTRILAECHDSTTGAHFGRDKTLDAIKQRFTWDGMATDVERYVSTCDMCQRNKPSQQLTPGLLMPLPIPEKPCLEWTNDGVSGLPKTKRGHDAIQVYVERLCKLKHFVAGKTTDGAAELASKLVHSVVRVHGLPDVVVSDRDPRFTANFYAELQRLMGITLKMSTSRHAQTDGQSEREIKTLITALRSFCNDHQDDWDDYLDMLELGFNATTQSSTQMSPFELMYGRKPRLPVDVALAPIAPKNPAAIDRAEKMQTALRFVKEHLGVAQERQRRNADRHRRDASFKVGDSVLLSTEGLELRSGTNKLCSRYVGPFEVIEVVNANAYKLKLPPQLQALHPTFNIEKLKPYRDGRTLFPTRPQRFDRPPPEIQADSNGDEQFVVDRILAQRKRGRSTDYLVAWKGYPPEENTWEPQASVRHTDAYAEFVHSQRVAA